MVTSAPCPFCTLAESRLLFRNDAAIAVRDAYPVTEGHTLVIPLRHVASFFDATAQERDAMLALLDQARLQLQSEFGPAGYNIGINDGPAAGQTSSCATLKIARTSSPAAWAPLPVGPAEGFRSHGTSTRSTDG